MKLTEFLLARIAEDEAIAQEARRDHYTVEAPLRYSETGYNTLPDLTIGPDRVLAECEAKRQIVERWPDTFGKWTHQQADAAGAVKDATLRAMALPYADHPDYREEWRP